jgi:F-type H+-transporting ATPase subunit delta
MTSRTAATRYARALFEVSVQENADVAAVDGSLSAFAALLRTHEHLNRVLLNPAVPAPRKRAAVAELVKLAPPPPPVSKLLLLLAERDRLGILPDLVDAFRQRVLNYQNVVRAEVTTAAPLDPEAARAIERKLAAATGRNVTLATSVDPSIIGGIVTRVGSTVYDGSISGQLDRMKKRLEMA